MVPFFSSQGSHPLAGLSKTFIGAGVASAVAPGTAPAGGGSPASCDIIAAGIGGGRILPCGTTVPGGNGGGGGGSPPPAAVAPPAAGEG